MTYFLYKCHTWRKFHKQQCSFKRGIFRRVGVKKGYITQLLKDKIQKKGLQNIKITILTIILYKATFTIPRRQIIRVVSFHQ
jgi:hypothetical protein